VAWGLSPERPQPLTSWSAFVWRQFTIVWFGWHVFRKKTRSRAGSRPDLLQRWAPLWRYLPPHPSRRGQATRLPFVVG